MEPKFPSVIVVVAPEDDPAKSVTRALAQAGEWSNGPFHEEIGPFLRRTHGKSRQEILKEAMKLATVKELL